MIQAIEPLGECESNVDLFRMLAQRMGFKDDCFSDSVDDMIDQALDSPNPRLKGMDRKRLEKEGHIRLNFDGSGASSKPFLPYADGNFQTQSGKAELYNERLKAEGLDPVAEFVAPEESRHSSSAKSFPLELLARKTNNFLNSTFSNLPSLQPMEQTGLLEMSRKDAEIRGIRDGVSSGVVAAKLNWAKLTPGNLNINVLTSEKLSDMGNSATFYSVLVEVELFRGSPDAQSQVAPVENQRPQRG